MIDLGSLHPTPAGWIRRSGLPARYRGITVADMDECRVQVGKKHLKVADSPVQDWLDGIRREGLMHNNAKGLLLVGIPGAGKTRLMSALLQEVALTVPSRFLGHSPELLLTTPIGFTTFSDLVETSKSSFNYDPDSEEWAKAIHKMEIFNAKAGDQWDVRVAGIDDVGKEHTTGSRFAEDYLDYLLRHRFDKGYPTLATSNKARNEWDHYGDSMVSFAHEAFTEAVILNVKGDGRR